MTRQEFLDILKDYCHNYEAHEIPDPDFRTTVRIMGQIRTYNDCQCPITFVHDVRCDTSDFGCDTRGDGHVHFAAEALGLDPDDSDAIILASDDGGPMLFDYDEDLRKELLEACNCPGHHHPRFR